MSASTPPDSQPLRALLDNDHRGIADIYSRYFARIERFVCANNGNSDDARDVFQEGLLAIARQARRPGFVLTCPFEAYLYLVCKGKWLNELKRRKRSMVTISENAGFTDEPEASLLADATLYEAERDKLFRRFFERLSEGCRTLLQLSWTGISMQEVSETLGITYGYARKRKAECVAQLTEWIQQSPEFSVLKH